ncbi:SUF system NifU family Fe-S cluster assembly protein [Candidatus Woesearchaeota archaeon]|nr:SUF system NifU family Fe-S cluster assembly protein [Candidatus Woesearchaeota archaeon]
MIDIYQEELFDHYKSPRNSGSLSNPTIKINDTNPLCGDEISVTVKLKEDTIKDIKFDSRGCAVSVASASKISEELKGKKIKDVLKLDEKFVLDLLGIPISPMRLKCALLSLRTLQKGISRYKNNEK